MLSINILQDFGLSLNEAKVYLAALELGQATVQDIARKSEIKRTTVYTTFPALRKKGLLSQFKKDKRALYVAENPESLLAFSARRHRQLQTILPELKSIHNRAVNKPKLKFYEGPNGYLAVYENILRDKPAELLAIASYQDFLKHIDPKIEESWTKRRVAQKIDLRWLDFRSPATEKIRGKDAKLRRELRFLPEEYNFTSTMFLYDDKAVIVSGKQKDFMAVYVENSEFSRMFRQVFRMLWCMSK